MAVSKVGSNIKWPAVSQTTVGSTSYDFDFDVNDDIWPNASGNVASDVTMLVDFMVVFTSTDHVNYHSAFVVRATYNITSGTLDMERQQTLGSFATNAITSAAALESGTNCRLRLIMASSGGGDATVKAVVKLYHET